MPPPTTPAATARGGRRYPPPPASRRNLQRRGARADVRVFQPSDAFGPPQDLAANHAQRLSGNALPARSPRGSATNRFLLRLKTLNQGDGPLPSFRGAPFGPREARD